MPNSTSEFSYARAVDVATRIRRREISPVEVVEDAIGHVEASNDALNAVVHCGFDHARAAARKAEQAVMTGMELGPLHGVPTLAKDMLDAKIGWPSTYGGIRALARNQARTDSVFVERIERAGAIVIGLTNSPVMGFRGTCDNPLFGPTHNPFDLVRNAGGSSGGGAAAVAAGIVPLAEGTDGGGSIRIPASWCGVYGLKPSWGRVPFLGRPNAFAAGTSPFLHTGPIVRSVEDAAVALAALAGYDLRDPFALDDAPEFVGAFRLPIKGMRIAYSPDFDVFPVDPRVVAVVESAVRIFERLDAHVEEVTLGIRHDQRALSDLWCRLCMPNHVTTIEALKSDGYDLLSDDRELPPQYRSWLEYGYRQTARELAQDAAMRTEVYDAMQGVFEKYDLLVGPTLTCLPVENATDGNTIGPTEVDGVPVDPLIGWCPPYLQNFTGHPAASVPAGLAGGLPVGMQVVGRRYADLHVLAASAAFERACPWSYDRIQLRTP